MKRIGRAISATGRDCDQDYEAAENVVAEIDRRLGSEGERRAHDGDVAGAKAQLAKVAEGHDPDPAEDARVKSIAKKIAAQMEKEGAR